MIDDDRFPFTPDEKIEMRKVRFRTLGCWPLTAAIESEADTLEAVIAETFNARKSEREGLPIVVVDEEIYRLLPSLLIATVDKFAQMPWNGKIQLLFVIEPANHGDEGCSRPRPDCVGHAEWERLQREREAGEGNAVSKRDDQ
jgi:hypothetical protein